MSNTAELSPALKQYVQIRSTLTDPNTILFFRMGDFYEMFFEDALEASRLLEITLTARNKNNANPVPLCGVPYHAAQGYIDRLLSQGKKVAICEQMEDPKTAKGVVHREITQIITPGVVLTENTIGKSSRYIVAVVQRDKVFGLACADASTGELMVTELSDVHELRQELGRKDPQEVLIDEALRGTSVATGIEDSGWVCTYFTGPASSLALPPAATLSDGEAAAAQLLWAYLHYTNRSPMSHFTKIQHYDAAYYVRLDESTIRHLELVRARESDGAQYTLLNCLDRTVTAMGARKLRHWVLHPLRNVEGIRNRQSMIAALVNDTTTHLQLRAQLESVSDLERIVGRVSTGIANARDLVALAQSLTEIPALQQRLQKVPALASVLKRLHAFPELTRTIVDTIVDEPPASVKEGGLIRSQVHAELDELRDIRSGGKQFIASLEEQERKRTGITSLKVGFNKVFGYFLEITHTHRDKVPQDYIRKQTLTNAERYITPELKQYEEKVLGAQERIFALEYELFLELRQGILPHVANLQATADALGRLDSIQGLALLAREEQYVCPEMCDDKSLEITDGRHPVVEQANRSERFVPNDVTLSSQKPMAIITGPNMAGKSTVMRQTALIALMAHMGSFVPAAKARIGAVDRIFTRVGASDNLARGQSTFMVEMTETARILEGATARSLIIIDEIGRGTSTYDGLSIAWAVAEYIHDTLKARCLFATHYHELTDLALTKSGVANFTMAVKEWNNDIIFLRKLVSGGASRSYGIQVAKLAGLPEAVIARSKEILANLEKGELNNVGQPRLAAKQSNASPEQQDVIDQLRAMTPESLTPIEALTILNDLKIKIS
ncbi:MAG: DNA mismatch repair protein MutS [Deltaproteobacteria bacterium CG11_big_fil_rev_8_21_14_0_20_47_16]|nr:MAG: DNA mismatch repair protein MutS [Deltaproteobacteria bacterium CG11_big_fil_rev_8_21_14_0_20_47_16]